MTLDKHPTRLGVLLSGGLDSCILVGHVLARGETVQPFYVRAGLAWEEEELRAAEQFLAAVRSPRLAPLVKLEMPVADLYGGNHWSISGRNVPDADSPDEAVFLPGRNALLILKAALWCQLHHIGRLALAPIGTNPFADTSPQFFASMQLALNCCDGPAIEVVRPFASLSKQAVMRLGELLPLELTFSCIAPIGGRHCGRCNKCAERRAAFATVGRQDVTPYAYSQAAPVPDPLTGVFDTDASRLS